MYVGQLIKFKIFPTDSKRYLGRIESLTYRGLSDYCLVSWQDSRPVSHYMWFDSAYNANNDLSAPTMLWCRWIKPSSIIPAKTLKGNEYYAQGE